MDIKRTFVKGAKFGLRGVNAVSGLATIIAVGGVVGVIGTAIGSPDIVTHVSSKLIEEVFKR